ncbi:MAG: NUDIX domain-containing protein, partial [Planctomycetota bacterium]|nr:NUDIX domain-containing protein [Planctomycetota bacterium]
MASPLEDVFNYCPICATESDCRGTSPFVCSQCGFHFFFPPAVAVGALICNADRDVLFLERAKEPGKGKLGLPGGFVDPGETAEQAIQREIKEEVGLVT